MKCVSEPYEKPSPDMIPARIEITFLNAPAYSTLFTFAAFTSYVNS